MTELFLARHRFSTGRTGSCRLCNNLSRTRQGHSRSPSPVSNVWPRCMISEGNHVKFARFVFPGRPSVSEDAKTWLPGLLRWPSKTSKKWLKTRNHKTQKYAVRSGTKTILRISWSWKHFFASKIVLRVIVCCLRGVGSMSSCPRIPHFIVLFSSGQRWLLVRGGAMGLCRRCVTFMSSCPRTLLPCHLATLLPCYLVTLLPCYPVTLLSSYPVTLLPFYPVTLLPCYPVTLLPCYPVTLFPCYLDTFLPCYPVTLLPCCPFTLLPC